MCTHQQTLIFDAVNGSKHLIWVVLAVSAVMQFGCTAALQYQVVSGSVSGKAQLIHTRTNGVCIAGAPFLL